jgi:hypothetical protein
MRIPVKDLLAMTTEQLEIISSDCWETMKDADKIIKYRKLESEIRQG